VSEIAKNKEILTKRIRRFFEDVPDERKPLLLFMESLEESGAEIFIFGGLIRDLCLKGGALFKSDVDIVIRLNERTAFEKYLSNLNYEKNKFGGYRIRVANWQVDLWEFKNTWAFTQGFVEPLNIGSLFETTFFNWDASFYDFNKQKLCCPPNYFSDISSKTLDMNLEYNPNEYSVFIRSLRLISKESACTGKKLSEFIVKHMKNTCDSEILNYEKKHFNSLYLNESFLLEIRSQIDAWNNQHKFSWITERQLKLFELCA
jgi:hypothetical protein